MFSETLEIVELGLAEGLIQMSDPDGEIEVVEKFLGLSPLYVEFSEE